MKAALTSFDAGTNLAATDATDRIRQHLAYWRRDLDATACEYLEQWKDRIVLHVLPCDAPETNLDERIGWRIHESITRNHRGPTRTIDQVYEWFDQQRDFVAPNPRQICPSHLTAIRMPWLNLARDGNTKITQFRDEG